MARGASASVARYSQLKPRAAPVARVDAGSSRARVFYCVFTLQLWDELLVAELPAQV